MKPERIGCHVFHVIDGCHLVASAYYVEDLENYVGLFESN